MGRMFTVSGVLSAPPPPKEAVRLVAKAIGLTKLPPRGWIDEDEAMAALSVSRDALTGLVREGFFEVSGYASERGNRRCVKRDIVDIFAKVFPNGSQPTGENGRMLIISALQFAKGRIARDEEFTALEAMRSAYETLDVAHWVYEKGVNRRAKGRPDKDTGIYRWPTVKEREEYAAHMVVQKEIQAAERVLNEARELEYARQRDEAQIQEEQELHEPRIQESVNSIMLILGQKPDATQEVIDGMIAASDCMIREEVRNRVTARIAERNRVVTDAELDRQLFNISNPIGRRTPFIMHAIHTRARELIHHGEPVNLTACEVYAAARFQASNWLKNHSVREPMNADLLFGDLIYPTEEDYRAYIAWRRVKLALQEVPTFTRGDIDHVMEGLSNEQEARGFGAISHVSRSMVFRALVKDGWSETLLAESAVTAAPVVETTPTYYVDRAFARERFGLTNDLLDGLVTYGAVRTTGINIVGDNGIVSAYHEIDLALYRYVVKTLPPNAKLRLIADKIIDLRPAATYNEQVLLIEGKALNTTEYGAVKGETDIYMTIPRISVMLEMHVGTVGALAALDIVRKSDDLISLLDVTIFKDVYDIPTLGAPTHDTLKDGADRWKAYIYNEHPNWRYSQAKISYERIIVKKKAVKKAAAPKPPVKKTTPKKAEVATKKAPAVKATPKKAAAPKAAAPKEKLTIKVRKETPREEAQEASAAAEALAPKAATNPYADSLKMIPYANAYKLFGYPTQRLKALVEMGILRGDKTKVSGEDVDILKATNPNGADTSTKAKVATLKKLIATHRYVTPVAVPVREVAAATASAPVVKAMISEAARIMDRKGDDEAEEVLTTLSFKSLDDVKWYFRGAMLERYGADPEDWPDVLRGVGLGLGVITKK